MKKSTMMFLMTNQGHGAREHMHGRRPAAFAPRGTRIAVVVRPGVAAARWLTEAAGRPTEEPSILVAE